jgi:putative DNA primase/helicase
MMKSVMQKLRNDSLAVMNELEPIVAGLGKTPTDDEDKIKARYKKAKRDYQWSVESESDRHIGGAVRQASSESACVVVADCDMDTHLYLINLQNGTYDLKAHQLRDPRREDYLTKLAPVTYDPLAKCVRFDAFLLEIFPDNQAIIDYLQRLLGYCLCGAAIERIVPFLIGAGANGKSVICNVMLFAIFGRTSDGYGMESNFSTFTTSKYQAPDKPRNDLVRMRSKRFVTASETDDPNVKMDTALLKKISGNDGIAVRGNFQQEIEYAPQAKVFLRMNNEPRILDATDSTWDRVKKISFTRQFSEDEKDPELTNKLMTESSGIFDWLLAGWMLVHAAWTNHEAALPEPAEMRMATDEYRQGQSRVARFFAEHYGVASHECEPIPIATMYAEYGKWLEKQGEHFKDTQNQFGRELTRHLAPHKKVVKGARGHGNVMSWCGVERIDAAQQSKQEEIPF